MSSSSSKSNTWLLALAGALLSSVAWMPSWRWMALAIVILLSPLLLFVHYTIAVIVTQVIRDALWRYYSNSNDNKKTAKRGTVIGQGEVRYADKSLVIGNVYPDDYDVTLPNPNTHSTSVAHAVTLYAPTGDEDLMIHGLDYADVSNLRLDPILQRIRAKDGAQTNVGTIGTDETYKKEMQKAFQYGWLHFASSSSSLFLLWVPMYGIGAWSVPPLGNNYPHSHCDADLTGDPMYSLTKGLSPWLFHRLSPLQLVNIWFPAQPVPCKPLVVMDTTTLDQADVFKHKLYNARGTVDAFTHTYNPNQRWVVPTEWRPTKAVVFRTALVPHTSSPLPGENLMAPLYQEVKRVRDCIQKALDSRNNSDPCDIELKVEKEALEEGDGEKELLQHVPILAKSLEELRSTLRQLPRSYQEAKDQPDKLQTLVQDLDSILRKSEAIRVAVRGVGLHWDLTIVSATVVTFLGTAWVLGGIFLS